MDGAVEIAALGRGMRLEVSQVLGSSENGPGRAGVLKGICDDYQAGDDTVLLVFTVFAQGFFPLRGQL